MILLMPRLIAGTCQLDQQEEIDHGVYGCFGWPLCHEYAVDPAASLSDGSLVPRATPPNSGRGRSNEGVLSH